MELTYKVTFDYVRDELCTSEDAALDIIGAELRENWEEFHAAIFTLNEEGRWELVDYGNYNQDPRLD